MSAMDKENTPKDQEQPVPIGEMLKPTETLPIGETLEPTETPLESSIEGDIAPHLVFRLSGGSEAQASH